MSGSGQPAVSIVMPCFNAAPFLRETIAGVIAQSFTDWELLVVDDGSTDDPEPIVSGFADERIHYLRIPPSGGPSRPRNLAIGQARGAHLFFFDADDVMLPGKLASQMALFATEPELGLTFTNFRVVGPQGEVAIADFLAMYSTFAALRLRAMSPSGRFDREAFHLGLMRANFIGTSSVAVRKDVLERVGGFDEGLASSEDADLWMRIARSFDCGYVDIIGHAYRRHPSSLMHEFDARHPLARIEVIRRHLPYVRDAATIRMMRRRLAENHVALGYISEVAGDYAAARDHYLESIRHFPSVGGALGALKCAGGGFFRRRR